MAKLQVKDEISTSDEFDPFYLSTGSIIETSYANAVDLFKGYSELAPLDEEAERAQSAAAMIKIQEARIADNSLETYRLEHVGSALMKVIENLRVGEVVYIAKDTIEVDIEEAIDLLTEHPDNFEPFNKRAQFALQIVRGEREYPAHPSLYFDDER